MTGGFEGPRPEANRHRTVFNHIGMCVADRARSRRAADRAAARLLAREPPTAAVSTSCNHYDRSDTVQPVATTTNVVHDNSRCEASRPLHIYVGLVLRT